MFGGVMGGLGGMMVTAGLGSLIGLLLVVVLWLGELWLFRRLTCRPPAVA
jgi:hypothetical protein